MQPHEAYVLLEALQEHPGILIPDTATFLSLLKQLEVPLSQFSQEIPDSERSQQFIPDTQKYHFVSLRRVLRNEHAKDKRPWLQRFSGSLARHLSVYSSSDLTSSIQKDDELVALLMGSTSPYSLLGKFQTYDYDNPDETLFVITRPLLIIPSANYHVHVLNWESRHTMYEQERGVFRNPKKVTLADYLTEQHARSLP